MWAALFGVALKYERRNLVNSTDGGLEALSDIPTNTPIHDVLCHRFLEILTRRTRIADPPVAGLPGGEYGTPCERFSAL